MRLNNEYLTGETVASESQAGFKFNVNRKYNAEAGSGFEQILSAAESKEAAQPVPEAKPVEKPKAKAAPKDEPIDAPEDEPREKEPVRDDAPKTDETKTEKPKETEKTEAVKKEAPKVNKEEAEEKIMGEIAQVLNVPVEQLTQWLNELNLTPADLADPKNVAALLQKMFDTPTAAGLLTIPEFPALFKAVNEVMEEFKPLLAELAAAETQAPVQAASALVPEGVAVETDDTGEAQVTFQNPETLTEEAAVADGQPADAEAEAEAETPTQTALPQTAAQNNAQSTGGQAGNPLLARDGNANAQPAETLDLAINTQTSTTQAQSTVARASETVRAASASVADANDVMNQVMSRIRTAGDSFSEIRMTLKPENLGDITLRVTTQNGIVTAQFVAESQRIKEILEANFNSLRDTLAGQGVNVSQLSVSVRQEDEQARMNQFAQGRQNSRARIQRITNLSASADAAPAEEEAEELTTGNVNIRV